MPMAISPSVLADWIQPGAALTAVFGLAGFLRAEIRSVRAEQQPGWLCLEDGGR